MSTFENVVNEAINDLKKKGSAYCFLDEQVKAIQKFFKNKIEVKEKDGIFYLKKVK